MTDIDATTRTRREQRFARLLRFYPAWYRAERGEEMLTTLLDVAAGRDRPGLGQRVDALVGGLRKHLACGSVPVAVVAGVLAVFGATVGGIAGTVAGWHTSVDLPDDDAADRIAATAVPDVDEAERYEYRTLFGWRDMEGDLMAGVVAWEGGDDHIAGHLTYEWFSQPLDDFTLVRTAEKRLAAAGWTIEPLPAPDPAADESFAATRDGLTVQVTTADYGDGTASTWLDIYRDTPGTVPAATAIGMILGGLVGWIGTGRIARRATNWQPERRRATKAPLIGAAAALALPTLFNTVCLVESLIAPRQRIAAWLGYTTGPGAYLTVVGAACLLVAAVSLAVPHWRIQRTAHWPAEPDHADV